MGSGESSHSGSSYALESIVEGPFIILANSDSEARLCFCPEAGG